MADGGAAPNRPAQSSLDGALLLQMLHRPRQPNSHSTPEPPPPPPIQHDSLNLHHDPAVAAVGPSYPYPPHSFLRPPQPQSIPIPPGFSPRHWAPPPGFPPGVPVFHGELQPPPGDLYRELRFPQHQGPASTSNALANQPSGENSGFWAGREDRGLLNSSPGPRNLSIGGAGDGVHGRLPNRNPVNSSATIGSWNRGQNPRAVRSHDPVGRSRPRMERPAIPVKGRPAGPLGRPKGPAEWVSVNERSGGRHNVDNRQEVGNEKYSRSFPPPHNILVSKGNSSGVNKTSIGSHYNVENGIRIDSTEFVQRRNRGFTEGGHTEEAQEDSSDGDVEESGVFEAEIGTNQEGADGQDGKSAARVVNALADQLVDTLILSDGSASTNAVKRVKASRVKDFRFDSFRGHHVSSFRMRLRRQLVECRYDIDRLAPHFLSIYQSLIPPSEEKAKQKQLLLSLERLVNMQWPKARLHLYGSCANSFGVSNSDIDICLAIDDDGDLSKNDILLKLADILQSDNLQNVQALTHARVPIVKLMDPGTGISCDICINNLLAVVNTKLLRDYAQIDDRLRQLAFIVKHWAKSRHVNETYRGTLSSYAYVIMCIHFLQQRKPAILPCLQQMKATYSITVDEMECAFFDQVEMLHNFGAQNNESIARLLWAFFHYWAYCHDYTNDVISIRTGSIISKRAKDWTRRIGNDRHLICIEDPFETEHDLGRVVDKYSIKILREEFERAANILQFDPNPSVTLFEPYIPPSSPQEQVHPELDD
ncbi:hypothetical protein J5N97_029354 [Dioscorea zingiberensis]|uniref:RNA uridylyltransferase n=1 Tax=Dioscorea zingiberensis TaxID=325984 RepID=A0A9D5H5U5_9LILI|nr:hypothetical protein J5N97_029354 [Dioscorea zingiberensis]